jgi:hypothetical protein
MLIVGIYIITTSTTKPIDSGLFMNYSIDYSLNSTCPPANGVIEMPFATVWIFMDFYGVLHPAVEGNVSNSTIHVIPYRKGKTKV